MRILAIDPGPEESSLVKFCSDEKRVIETVTLPNEKVLSYLFDCITAQQLVIEKVACMGMAVGASVFETVYWSGRFSQLWEMRHKREASRITRHQVKMHLCGSMRAKDANIRQAIIDKLGPVGTKGNPGPCYGVSKHLWAALAVAVTFSETNNTL